MFKIITQTDDFVVVNKSEGVNFHDEKQPGSGLFSQVKKQMKMQYAITELYPIHRLDKMTSGLILFAKNIKSAQVFGKLFEEHNVEKYYLAISDKKPTKKQGLIKGDMAKSRRGMFKLLRTMDNPAITQFFSYPIANKQRLYLLKPHSGKTHQLRVALSSIGAPILGDPLYNSNSVADRGYLHAYALRFNFSGTIYQFILPSGEGEFYLTQSIKDKLTELDQPWLLNWPK
jgi:tRNA pseudouridine32 synthase/23S rRNA pseudouridine746 synthase